MDFNWAPGNIQGNLTGVPWTVDGALHTSNMVHAINRHHTYAQHFRCEHDISSVRLLPIAFKMIGVAASIIQVVIGMDLE